MAVARIPGAIAGSRTTIAPLPVSRARAAVAAAAARRCAQHGIAHGLDTMLAQALGGAFVFLYKQLTQQVPHVLHPELPDFGGHARIADHPLQGPYVTFGAQRVALGLHTAQPLCRADQGVEFSQHSIGGMQGRLLGLGELHLRQHLVFVHERQLTEIHAGVVGRIAPLGDSRPLCKDFQQGHGVTLDQRSLMLVEVAQAVADQIALLDADTARLFLRQGPLGDLDQLLHQCLAPAHGVDDTGTKHGSRTRRRLLGHGGEESANRFPVAILLDLKAGFRSLSWLPAAYFRAL